MNIDEGVFLHVLPDFRTVPDLEGNELSKILKVY